jgi:hypothetical protein
VKSNGVEIIINDRKFIPIQIRLTKNILARKLIFELAFPFIKTSDSTNINNGILKTHENNMEDPLVINTSIKIIILAKNLLIMCYKNQY